MEEQKTSDDTDQQKTVKFDDKDDEKPAKQEKDNRQDDRDREDEDEGRTSRVSRSSRSTRASSADIYSGKSDEQKLEQIGDNVSEASEYSIPKKDQSPDNGKGNQFERFEETTSFVSQTDDEKLQTENANDSDDVNKSTELVSKSQTSTNNTDQKRTSNSLNSRRENRDSFNEQTSEKTPEDSKYETDDDKASKQDVTSPAHSTGSNASAKYMIWDDNARNGASKKELNDENTDEDKEIVHEKKDTYNSNATKDHEDKEKQSTPNQTTDNNDTPKSGPEKNETRKTNHTVTLVTKRQSASKPTPQAQNKDFKERRQVSKSATYPSRKQPTRSATTSTGTPSRASTARSYRPPSRPRTILGYNPETRRERDFFHKELQRLKQSLRQESKNIKKPKVRDHYPDVFTSLEPYYNTYTANYLIKMPDLGYKEKQPSQVKDGVPEDQIKYTSRRTAIGLCDPWDSFDMDTTVLPKLETVELRRRRMDQMHASQSKPKSARASSNTDRSSQSGRTSRIGEQDSQRQKRPEAKQGSTRLPKFPVIMPPNSELATKELHYGDVPSLREELKSFSHYGEDRKKSDYTRTRQDFYRMELDRLEDYHVGSRPHMRAAYFAYLQNTPGSRKAIYDCMKETSRPKEKEEPTAQAVA